MSTPTNKISDENEALDLDALRSLAESATQGEWEAGVCWVFTDPVYDDDKRLSNVLGMKFYDPARVEIEEARGQANANFIAAANPVVVQRLIAELESCRRDRDNWHRRFASVEKELAEKTEQVLALHKTWYEVNGKRYEERCYVIDDVPADHVCITDRSNSGEVCDPENGEHYALGCVECRQATEDGTEAHELWPCQTLRIFAPPSSVEDYAALGTPIEIERVISSGDNQKEQQ